jgi:hypothetical protein
MKKNSNLHNNIMMIYMHISRKVFYVKKKKVLNHHLILFNTHIITFKNKVKKLDL